MIDNHMPVLTERASCQDYPADWWFPQEVAGTSKKWSRTPEAMKARKICEGCLAQRECLNYALAYSGLAGIWGGLDYQERRVIQEKLGITPIFMLDTYDSRFYKGGESIETE